MSCRSGPKGFKGKRHSKESINHLAQAKVALWGALTVEKVSQDLFASPISS